MADYQPLIAKAVSGLEKNTGEARRVLYERARKALVGQLRNMTPPLTESEITRERLALEEAIRKVEADAARRMRLEPSQEGAPATPAESPPSSEGQAATPAPQAAPEIRPEAPGGPVPSPAPAASRKEAPAPSGPARFFRRARPAAERSDLSKEGLKGFRDVVAEAESLGEKTAQGARSAREAYAAVPASVGDLDRMEPRVEPEGLRGPGAREAKPREPMPRAPAPPPPPRPGEPPSAKRGEVRTPPAPPPRRPATQKAKPPPRSRKGAIAALLTLVIIVALALTAVWKRDRIAEFFGAVRGLAPLSREAQPQKPKIPDRVGQDTQAQPQTAQPPATVAPAPPAAVAQRVVLYEEDPAEPAGKRYVGSAIWRTETVSPGPGLASELAVRCDVEIPERRLGMTLSIRRNTDAALPASHTIEIVFNLPADFPFGGINNVPGILMKQAEQTRGAPLSGLAVKVTSGFFLVGLSAVDTEKQRNIELLKERSWFDIPIVYNNGRRAILAVEKGNPGERAFNLAFAAWKQ
jgi:hypothetical protein